MVHLRVTCQCGKGTSQTRNNYSQADSPQVSGVLTFQLQLLTKTKPNPHTEKHRGCSQRSRPGRLLLCSSQAVVRPAALAQTSQADHSLIIKERAKACRARNTHRRLVQPLALNAMLSIILLQGKEGGGDTLLNIQNKIMIYGYCEFI